MSIWKDVPSAPGQRINEPASVVIGTFDGVHRGHRHLVACARDLAPDMPTVAITFDPHPIETVAPGRAPMLLLSLQRRVELLKEAGADEVRVLDFSAQMAAKTPEDFIAEVLVAQCMTRHVTIGMGFRFGHKASGTIQTLVDAGATYGFSASEQPLLADGVTISSTRIREAIEHGELDEAARLLGRPHEFDGVVIKGNQRGRELGFPTANLHADSRRVLGPDGVYAGWLVDGETRHPAAISVGTNPTFDDVAARRVEAYVLDRDDLDLYGRHVRVEFVAALRPMVQFDSLEALVEQMGVDVSDTRMALEARDLTSN